MVLKVVDIFRWLYLLRRRLKEISDSTLQIYYILFYIYSRIKLYCGLNSVGFGVVSICLQ